jgi:hypothetical protein
MEAAMHPGRKLERELATWAKHQAELEKLHPEKFVLIHGDEVVNTYDTFENAAAEGLRRFPEDDFLVRQIKGQRLELPVAVIYGLTGVNIQDRPG